jgi:NAD(P)-dependent dehydrogenase (short-subunit alcohol dehydrogenase family)
VTVSCQRSTISLPEDLRDTRSQIGEADGMSGMLDGKVALISGCGAGIGAAASRLFAANGATLWLNDRNSDSYEALLAELAASGAVVGGVVGDMSDPTFVNSWVQSAVDAYGRIDVLYNNVGVSRSGLIAELSDDDWRFQQSVTLDSVFYATRAVLPHMISNGGGSIVSMSSGAGIGGNYNLGGYAAAKAGVINLMETVATEYGSFGIRANAVTPGPTATAPLLDYLASQPGGIEAHVADLDLQRLSEPEEVAQTVLWLASDFSSNITGICVRSNIRAASRRPHGS